MNKHVIIPISAAAAGLVSGFGVGYFVAKTRLEALMELRFQEELISVKDAFDRGQKAGQYGTPESAVAALVDPEEQAAFLAKEEFKEKYVTPSFEGTSDEEPFELAEDHSVKSGTVNIFEQEPILVAGYPNPDDENAPYLISVDQFHEEHEDYDKNSIVYYAGDLVLADETEAEIHDIPNTVAPDFMDHFGDLSGDENIVYYRNDRLGIDFEISRDLSLYAEKVMGIMPEPENDVEASFQKISRKRRARDDRDD